MSSVLYAYLEFAGTGQDEARSTTPVAAPVPAWIEIPSPLQIFRLEQPEVAGVTKFYIVRQHRTGGGRQDILEFGGSSANASVLNLLFYQPGSEAVPEPSFFVELARRAAESGRAVIRAEQPVKMTTKFGAFEMARLDLARDGAGARDCLGFRFASLEPGLRITGFACGGDDFVSPLTSKAALACLIDRIDLAPGAEDKGLLDFFAAHYALGSPECPAQESDPLPSPPARLVKTGGGAPVKRPAKSH